MEEFVMKYGAYAGLAILVIEYVLGKTDLVKANSSVELALNAVVKLLDFLFMKKEAPKIEE